jgi:hypothetical protein
MNIIRRTLGAATVLAAVAGVASANTLTVSGFYSSPQSVTSLNQYSCQGTTNGGPVIGDANCTITDWAGSGSNHDTPFANISVDLFDSSLGTLNSVTVQFTGALESTIKFTSTAATHVNAYTTSLDLAALDPNATGPYTPYLIDGSGTPCLATQVVGNVHICSTGVDQTIATITPGDYDAGTVIGPQTYNFFLDSGPVSVSTAGWSALGGGTLIVPVLGIVHTTTDTTGGNFTAEQVTTAVANLTVTYDYSPPTSTPEPGTLLLMGTALIGAGFLRKRRKA